MFVTLYLEPRVFSVLVKMMPEKWWRAALNDVERLAHNLQKLSVESLAVITTRVSMSIGNNYIKQMPGVFRPQLVNCTISEGRLVTINIPLPGSGGDQFYQIRMEPATGTRLQVRIFYPAESGAAKWFGKLAAGLVYDHGLRKSMVEVDGESVSIGAWNAMCALLVAQDCEGGGEVGILMDMAREGVI